MPMSTIHPTRLTSRPEGEEQTSISEAMASYPHPHIPHSSHKSTDTGIPPRFRTEDQEFVRDSENPIRPTYHGHEHTTRHTDAPLHEGQRGHHRRTSVENQGPGLTGHARFENPIDPNIRPTENIEFPTPVPTGLSTYQNRPSHGTSSDASRTEHEPYFNPYLLPGDTSVDTTFNPYDRPPTFPESNIHHAPSPPWAWPSATKDRRQSLEAKNSSNATGIQTKMPSPTGNTYQKPLPVPVKSPLMSDDPRHPQISQHSDSTIPMKETLPLSTSTNNAHLQSHRPTGSSERHKFGRESKPTIDHTAIQRPAAVEHRRQSLEAERPSNITRTEPKPSTFSPMSDTYHTPSRVPLKPSDDPKPPKTSQHPSNAPPVKETLPVSISTNNAHLQLQRPTSKTESHEFERESKPSIDHAAAQRKSSPLAPVSSTKNTSVRPELPHQTSSQMHTRYVNMLLALDTIPQLHNILASFFTWILLAGFVLFPGTFTSLQTLNATGLTGTVQKELLNTVSHVSLFVIAFVCCGIGATGMCWLWWRWMHNYLWLLNKIFLPGLLNSLAGVISTIVNIFGVQHGHLSTTAKVTVVVTSATAFVCGVLVLFYQFWLVRRLKAEHDRQVGVMETGKHGEGLIKNI